jgi:PAS domain-containing protein
VVDGVFVRTTFTPDILEGQVRGIFVLAIDITEEKLAQEAVNRSDERYKAFIKHSTEGIWRFELEKPIPTNLSDRRAGPSRIHPRLPRRVQRRDGSPVWIFVRFGDHRLEACRSTRAG